MSFPCEEPLVSIIIPCYNAERYLSQTLDSVLWQTYSNWECLLIDDGSTDRSAEIYESYKIKDSRFFCIKQRNSGAPTARNTGIDHAKGNYIQFLDADDLLLPDKLAACINHFKQDSTLDAVYCDYICFDENNKFTHSLPSQLPYDDPLRSFLFEFDRSFVVVIHAWLFKREIFSNHRFVATFRYSEDYDLWTRLIADGLHLIYHNEVMVMYRRSSDSITSNEVNIFKAEIDIVRRYAQHPMSMTYQTEYQSRLQYLNERLVIAYFLQKQFMLGIRQAQCIWKTAKTRSRIKCILWLILMRFLSKRTAFALRDGMLTSAIFKQWTESIERRWIPPVIVEKLIESKIE